MHLTSDILTTKLAQHIAQFVLRIHCTYPVGVRKLPVGGMLPAVGMAAVDRLQVVEDRPQVVGGTLEEDSPVRGMAVVDRLRPEAGKPVGMKLTLLAEAWHLQ